MKKILFFVIASLSFLFMSCLKNDDTPTEYAKDAAITAFSISNIKTTVTCKTYDGAEDSTYTVTLTGSKYTFVIDQLKGEIYNTDSLDYGTDIRKVVTNATYNYSLAFEKNGIDTIYSQADSIDFTSPVKFTSYAQNGSRKIYTVRVNVHQCNPDSMIWNPVNSNFDGTQIASKQKAVVMNGEVYVYGQTAGQPLMTKTSESDGSSWTSPAAVSGFSGTETGDYSSAIIFNDKIYMLSDAQKLYSSADGAAFSQVATGTTLFKRVFAVNKTTLWALSTSNQLIYSEDGTNWTVNSTLSATDASYFPDTFLSFASYPKITNSQITLTVLAGIRSAENDSTAMLWSAERNYTATGITGNTNQAVKWGKYTSASYFCPNLEDLSMIHYGDTLYAFGGQSHNKTPAIKALKSFYKSTDEGISWREVKKDILFPSAFLGTSSSFSYIVDDSNHLWLIFSGNNAPNNRNVWKGIVRKLDTAWQYK